jgi:photosystem II stability/assembly factor-like uncharacterized protein
LEQDIKSEISIHSNVKGTSAISMKHIKSSAYSLIVVLGLSSCAGEQGATVESTERKPEWQSIERITKNHLRGLFMVNDSVAWASGTDGTVIKTTDGNSWTDVSVHEVKNLDFRDIHAFDENNALVMNSGNGLSIYRTSDGGATWNLVFQEADSSYFFDGMDFNANGIGYAYGDPVDGKMTLIESIDFGKHWNWVDEKFRPVLDSAEASYAASGTGIKVMEDQLWIATSGGKKGHVYSRLRDFSQLIPNETPLFSEAGAGIFSIAFWNINEGVIVGGSYIDSTNASSNCAITNDGGKTWELITENNPRGYRSCVTSNKDGSLLLAVGRSGSEYSIDKGKTWIANGDEGYFSCSVSNEAGWAVGRNGKMAELSFN